MLAGARRPVDEQRPDSLCVGEALILEFASVLAGAAQASGLRRVRELARWRAPAWECELMPARWWGLFFRFCFARAYIGLKRLYRPVVP